MPDRALIAAVRRFTRFYTRRVGVLQEGLLGSPFSLAEARVLYEVAQREGVAAADLAKALGLDAGYLSRILKGFAERGLVAREPSPTDGRQSLVALTPEGRAAFDAMDLRSRDEIGALLEPLAASDRRRLVSAMATVERLLDPPAQPPSRIVVLRPHRPGDMGFITHRQAVLYADEYGWDETFEALVAEITAAFVKSFDPTRERCWIAELDGEIVGSVFVVRCSDEVAKLRLLYVEPQARGLGLGRRLVGECVSFAREAGYRRMTLWTNDVLHAARKLYVDAGFVLTAEERHRSFGRDLVGQNWELAL